jgi:hypothetical protein
MAIPWRLEPELERGSGPQLARSPAIRERQGKAEQAVHLQHEAFVKPSADLQA